MSADFPATSRIQLTTTAGAGLAVALTASAFSAILLGTSWVLPAIVTIAAVGLTGLACRALGWWPPLIVLAQLAAVLIVLTMLFSSNAFLGVIPDSATLEELRIVLNRALDVVRTGVPPVPAEPALQCLVSLGLGLVAVLVDAISVAVATPAVAGLVLLCVYALPVSLDPRMLPWWTFVAAAAGFSLLLLTQRGGWRTKTRSQAPILRTRGVVGQQFTAIGGAALVVALLVGTTFTGVGTEGRLPGDSGTAGGIGVRPFTSLRGQLNRDRAVDLFRVHGLAQDTYLRVMTLRDFNPDRGWELGTLSQGVDAGSNLPLPDGTVAQPPGRRAQVEIEPLGYRDPWLPAFGVPLEVSPPGPGWRYDHGSGTLFTQVQQELRPYAEQFVLPDPTPDQLRADDGAPNVDPAYLNTAGIPPDITDFAKQVTAAAPTRFDKAVVLNRLFTDPANGFSYDLQTAPSSSGSALSDFLFRGKRGYCEQFASAMGVLLRSNGIPARVAVGFTSGYREGPDRVITTEDAHAWVEAFFPGAGWVTFDPTPLRDGRTSLPRYLTPQAGPLPPPPPAAGQPLPAPPQPSNIPQPSGGDHSPGQPGQYPPAQRSGPDTGFPWQAVVIPLVVLVLLAAPGLVRQLRRRRCLSLVDADIRGAAGLAWREVLNEYWDRGVRTSDADTARTAARNLLARHSLDRGGTEALEALVLAVERDWYAPSETGARNSGVPVQLRTVLESIRNTAPLGWRQWLLPRSVLRPLD